MYNKLYDLTRSSVDPATMSLMVRGLLWGIAPLVVFFGIDTETWNNFVELFVKAVAATVAAVALWMTVYGAIRKVIMRFGK